MPQLTVFRGWAVLTFLGLMPGVYQLVAWWVVGAKPWAWASEREQEGGNWRGSCFLFPYRSRKVCWLLSTSHRNQWAKGSLIMETLAGRVSSSSHILMGRGVFGCPVLGQCLTLWSVSHLVHRTHGQGSQNSRPISCRVCDRNCRLVLALSCSETVSSEQRIDRQRA